MISRWWWGPKHDGELWHKDEHVRSFDGTNIRYTLLGRISAPVVALCAGFLCPDSYWKYIVPELASSHRLLVWNYRGIGVSELPRRPGFHATNIKRDELGIEANAKDLWAILSKEHIDRAVLVGHSMGFQVALEGYRQFSERVAGLVSIGGGHSSPLHTFFGTDISARVAPYALPLLHVLPRVTLLAWRAVFRNPLNYRIGRHVLGAVGDRTSSADMEGYFHHISMTDPLIAAKMVEAMHAHSAEDLLDDIAVPVLLLHGTKDPFTPLSVARDMDARIPESRLVAFEGGSHTLPLEYPHEIADEMKLFLKEVVTS